MAETPAARLLRHARYSAPPHAHLRDGRTLIAAKELCATLGSLSSISAWVHHLLPALATTPEGTAGAFKAPALWLLDQLLRGAGGGGRWHRVGRVAGLVVEARDEVDKEEVDEGLGADADADVDEEADEGAGVEAGVKAGADAPRPSTTAAEAREAAAAALDTAPAPPLMGAIIGASSAAEVEECMLMLLREVLTPELWNAPSAVSGATSPASLRRQHATLVEHEAMIELVGSAVELLAAAVRARAAQALGVGGSVGGGGVGGVGSFAVARALMGFVPFLFVMGVKIGMHNGCAATAASLGGVPAAAHTALFATAMLCFTMNDVGSSLCQAYLPAFSSGGTFNLQAARPTLEQLLRCTLCISLSVVALSSFVLLGFGSSFTTDPAVLQQMHQIVPLMATTLSLHGTAITLEGMMLARRAFRAMWATYAFIALSVTGMLAIVRRSSHGLLSGLSGVWRVYIFFQLVRILGFAWGGGLLQRQRARPVAQ